MTAGLNIKINIIRKIPLADDSIGGAQNTETTVYRDVPAAISARKPSQQSLEQGLETNRLFDMTCRSQGITLYEADDVEVVWPEDHLLHYKNMDNERLRIVGMQPPRRRRTYGAHHAILSRIGVSRSQQ